MAVADGRVVGFSRSHKDGGFHVFVYDLLVSQQYRGGGIGRKLMEVLWEDYPAHEVYVLSDADGYYQKQGYEREGTVFCLRRNGKEPQA